VVVVSVLVNAPDEGGRNSVQRAKALGAASVLSKPVDRSSLVAVLKAQIHV
jgi:AmiR/NasT family two-component response regulator